MIYLLHGLVRLGTVVLDDSSADMSLLQSDWLIAVLIWQNWDLMQWWSGFAKERLRAVVMFLLICLLTSDTLYLYKIWMFIHISHAENTTSNKVVWLILQ